MDDDVAFNRGEDKEQVTHNGPVQIDVPEEVKKIKVTNLTYYI
jgi:hypothetical protein